MGNALNIFKLNNYFFSGSNGAMCGVSGVATLGGLTDTAYPMDGLTSYWKLNESSNRLEIRKDSFGTNHLAPFGNSPFPTFVTDGRLGNATRFTGTAGLVRDGINSPSLTLGDFDFTVTCWFRIVVLAGTSPTLIAKGNGVGTPLYDMELYHFGAGNHLQFELKRADGSRIVDQGTSNSVSANAWNFGVGWHDSVARTVNVQLNNSTVASFNYTGAGPASTNAPWWIGNDFFLTDGIGGDISDVAFYRRVLTSAERNYLYNGGSARQFPL